MKMLLWPLRVVYVLYAFALFLVLMVPVFIWTLVVTPLGRIRGGNLTYYACMAWADAWFFGVGIRHRNLYEEPLQKGSPYIFVANHISYLDIPVLMKTFRHPVRPLGKAEMTRVPLFGTIYKNAIVTVDRGSAGNRVKSVRILRSILQKGISVLVFPEGTFNETGKPLQDFFNGAFRIAIETQTPIKPVLMLDAYDRMHYRSLFSLTPGRSRSVFLAEVPTKGLTLKDVGHLKQEVYAVMEQKLREYKASWIKH